METTNQFKVVLKSNNTNSFGLRQFIMVARDGLAFNVCRSAYNGSPEWNRGDLVDVPSVDFRNPDFTKLGCELVTELPMAPQNVIDEVFGSAKP